MAGLDTSLRRCYNIDKVISWLRGQLYTHFRSNEVNAWVFGSWVRQPSYANDCDVLLLVKEDSIDRLASISIYLKQEFEEQFGIPLHLTRLSFQEAKGASVFINAIFAKPTIRL